MTSLKTSSILSIGLALMSGSLLFAEPAKLTLDDGFQDPPLEARPTCFWSWLSGHLTHEGLRLDLEDMKRIGMSGGLMQDIGMFLPEGPAPYASDAWFDDVQYAIKTSNQLGLKFLMQPAAGWSVVGGPSVTPAQSMKKFTFSETDVDGGRHLHQKLAQPYALLNFYRDARCVAVPADPAPDAMPTVTANFNDENLDTLPDGKPGKVVVIDQDAPVFTFTFPQAVPRRSLVVRMAENNIGVDYTVHIEASDDGQVFRPVRDITQVGRMLEMNTVTLPFPSTTAKVFRVTFDLGNGRGPRPMKLMALQISPGYRLDNSHAKDGSNFVMGSVIPSEAPSTSTADAIAPDQVIDLTSHLAADGTLDWDAPAGRWTIIRLGYTSTARTNHPNKGAEQGEGLEVDKMDGGALRDFLSGTMAKVIKRAGPLAGKSFGGFFIDSWEVGTQNWTAKFPDEFKRRRGYDLTAFVPVLTGRVVGSPAESEAFLGDVRRTIGELFTDEFYGTLQSVAHEHGMISRVQPYGDDFSFSEFQAGDAIDQLDGEYWTTKEDGDKLDLDIIKSLASIVHVTGRKVLGAEAFTAVPGYWQGVPSNLKFFADRGFAAGVNQIVFADYDDQPIANIWPGFERGQVGTNFGRLNTWWPQVKPWVDYLSRCSFLLQQGHYVADFLFLKNEEPLFRHQDEFPALPEGYADDEIGPRQLAKAVAENHRVRVPGGGTYAAIVVPRLWEADIELLRKLQSLAKAGVPILGPAPIVPRGHEDLTTHGAEWKQIVQDLWSTDKPASLDPQSFVSGKIDPDFIATSSGASLKLEWAHRATGDEDIYFLANPTDKPVSFTASFRVTGKQPELWDAVAGTRVTAPVARANDKLTETDLSLPGYGSVFVVFREPIAAPAIASVNKADGSTAYVGADFDATKSGWALRSSDALQVTRADGTKQPLAADAAPAPISVDGPWNVTFHQPGCDAFTRKFDKLHSFLDDTDDAVKYFSGQAIFTATVTVTDGAPKKARAMLDLGDVWDLATVEVNGEDAGTVWIAPYTLDVTPLLKAGENTVKIIVADRWINRLIGDEQFAPDVKYKTTGDFNDLGAMAEIPAWFYDSSKPRTHHRSTFTTWDHFLPELKGKDGGPLVPAGLGGPVQVRFEPVATPR